MNHRKIIASRMQKNSYKYLTEKILIASNAQTIVSFSEKKLGDKFYKIDII
jgi:hypothetical protein